MACYILQGIPKTAKEERRRRNIKLVGFVAIIPTLGPNRLHQGDGSEPPRTEVASHLYPASAYYTVVT